MPNHLIGFGNDRQNGTGIHFNFILSNGNRSTQKDKGKTYYDNMIPADTLHKIRSVKIYYPIYPDSCIYCFCFFDKDGALLWEIGDTTQKYYSAVTVLLEENEVIVGVVAKLYPGY